MTKDEIIKALRDMARYPTVTLPRDSEALKVAADLLAQPEQDTVQRLSALVRAQQITIDKLEAKPEQEPVEWGVDWGKDGNSVSIIKRLADGNIEVLAWEYAPYTPQRTWVGLMRGVRVDGDTVVIAVKGGNDAARELCGALIEEMNT